MSSKFRNKQLYTDVFPQFQQGLVGTEYQYQRPPPPPAQTQVALKQTKQLFGEVPTAPPAPLSREGVKLKKTLPTPPLQPTAKPDTPIPTPTTQTVSMTGYTATNKYDASLHQKTPKSQLDLPLQVALKLTYPQNIKKYETEAQRYGYFIDPLSDEEHVVLYNPSAKKVIMGVRGTDLTQSADVYTDIGLVFSDIKNFDRYKKAEEKYKQVKSKFNNMPIIHASHSIGGLISSQLAQPEDKVYSYNRPYFSYPIRKNEVAISVESDPLLNTLNIMGSAKNKEQKPTIIPRTHYGKAINYIEIEKSKINPNYEEKPIQIPEKYKTDVPNIQYQNILKGALPGAYLAYKAYEQYITKPEIYRQDQIALLQREAGQVQQARQRMGSVSARAFPGGTSPRTMGRIEQIATRPLTQTEQNILNPTFLDTTKRLIRTMARDPISAGIGVLSSPPVQYALTNYVGGYVANREIDSHSIDNLPLKIRIE
jgi:hypothetical protein